MAAVHSRGIRRRPVLGSWRMWRQNPRRFRKGIDSQDLEVVAAVAAAAAAASTAAAVAPSVVASEAVQLALGPSCQPDVAAIAAASAAAAAHATTAEAAAVAAVRGVRLALGAALPTLARAERPCAVTTIKGAAEPHSGLSYCSADVSTRGGSDLGDQQDEYPDESPTSATFGWEENIDGLAAPVIEHGQPDAVRVDSGQHLGDLDVSFFASPLRDQRPPVDAGRSSGECALDYHECAEFAVGFAQQTPEQLMEMRDTVDVLVIDRNSVGLDGCPVSVLPCRSCKASAADMEDRNGLAAAERKQRQEFDAMRHALETLRAESPPPPGDRWAV